VVVALKQYRPPAGASSVWPMDGTWHQISDQAGLLAGLPVSDHLVRVREVFLGAVSAGGVGVGQRFDTPFVVMEWLEGRSPAELMRSGPVGLASRLAWIAGLVEAVALLHSPSRTAGNPLVHTDIKPGNCLVVAGRGLVLTDTGAVHRVSSLGNRRGLRSPPYAAPEVLASPGRRPSVEADVYAVGAVAFFLLTGQAPPDARRSGFVDEARRVLLGQWSQPGPRTQAARERVTEMVVAMLAVDPAARPLDVVHWAKQLCQAALPEHRWRSRPAVLTGAAALTAIAATSTLLTLHPWQRDNPIGGVGAAPPSQTPTQPRDPPDTTPASLLHYVTRTFRAQDGTVQVKVSFVCPIRSTLYYHFVGEPHTVWVTPPPGVGLQRSIEVVLARSDAALMRGGPADIQKTFYPDAAGRAYVGEAAARVADRTLYLESLHPIQVSVMAPPASISGGVSIPLFACP
jgi:serine/threonine protein kinase